MEEPQEELEWVTCGCCGRGIKNDAKHNMDYEVRAHDYGFGMCKRCGDWSYNIFMKARFPIVEKMLNLEQLTVWKTWSFDKKALLISRLIEKGAMI